MVSQRIMRRNRMKIIYRDWQVRFSPNYKVYQSYLNSLSKDKFIDLKVDLQIANSKESLMIHGAFLFGIVLAIQAIWWHWGKLLIQIHQKYNLLLSAITMNEARLLDVTYTISLWLTFLLIFLFGGIVFKIRLQQRKLYYLKQYKREMKFK